MKTLFKSLAVAATVALPFVAGAQPIDNDVQVTLTGTTRLATGGTGFAGRTGGGFSATFTADFGGTIGERTFTDWLVWCIDPTRNISVGSTTSKSLFTLQGFANSGFGSDNYPALGLTAYDPDGDDMKRIASLANDLENDWANAGLREDRQGGIWANFTGTTPPAGFEGDASFDGSQYYVLWGNAGVTQTLITRIPDRFLVPEPGSLALLVAGMGGMLVAVRRRRQA